MDLRELEVLVHQAIERKFAAAGVAWTVGRSRQSHSTEQVFELWPGLDRVLKQKQVDVPAGVQRRVRVLLGELDCPAHVDGAGGLEFKYGALERFGQSRFQLVILSLQAQPVDTQVGQAQLPAPLG